MRFSRVGKWWFGLLFAAGAKQVWDERQAYHARQSNFNGYPWPQVDDVIRMCYQARPDIQSSVMAMTHDSRMRFVAGLFTCLPVTFKDTFGFDRPPPRGH